jgi:hypothetical protein
VVRAQAVDDQHEDVQLPVVGGAGVVRVAPRGRKHGGARGARGAGLE